MTAAQPAARAATHTLRTADLALDVDVATGWIRALRLGARGVDLFRQVRQNQPGWIGGLRVYDERDRRWYDDRETAFAIADVVARDDGFAFTKRFAGAPFVLAVELRVDHEALHWEVRATKSDPSVADRSLRVHAFLPLVAGWDVWAPAHDAEFTFDGMTSFEYNHVQVPYVSNKESILPIIAHYNRDLDVGLTMIVPIDRQTPWSRFQFANGDRNYNWGAARKDLRDMPVLEAAQAYIGLVGDRALRTGWMVMAHEGDWRPGLGKVFRRWREFFVPCSDAIYRFEGTFTCEGVHTSDEIQRCRDFRITTLEVHNHFEHYGDYLQGEKESWIALATKEGWWHAQNPKPDAEAVQRYFATHDDAAIAAELKIPLDRVRHTRADVKRRLQALSDAGVGLYWYFNYSDGFRPYVEREFPDSICANEDGAKQASGWFLCHNLNVDLRWSFGQATLRDARRIFETYPMLNGFFLDCFRHYDIDFAHDDGVTVVNNKPAYSINFAYDGIQEAIRRDILKDTRATFANKPQTIRTMRWVDGVLLEGGGDVHEEKYFWACIAKPLFFMWTSDEHSVDENYRRAVYHGSWPKYAAEKGASYAENLALFERYRPLFERFPRRVFCFEPDPLRVPTGSRGKLYTVGDDYVAGIFSAFGGAGDEIRWRRQPHAAFRVRRGHDVGKVGVMVPGDRDWRFVDFRFDGTVLFVPLVGYQNCAVVRLFVTRDTGKAIGAERFRRHVDYCGDPENSFSERNAR